MTARNPGRSMDGIQFTWAKGVGAVKLQTVGHTITPGYRRADILADSRRLRAPLERILALPSPRTTLGVKLGGLAGLLLLALLAVGIYSVWQIRGIGVELDALVRNDLAISASLKTAERNSSARRNSLNEMAQLRDQDRLDLVGLHADSVATNGDDIAFSLSTIDEIIAVSASSNRQAANDRYGEFARFLLQAKSIETAISSLSADYVSALQVEDGFRAAPALTRLLNRSDALDQTLLLMDGELQRLLPESAASAQDRQRTATTATVIVAIVALVLGGLISLVLIRRLTMSIKTVAGRAREIERTIGTETFSHRDVPVTTSDEVGDLTAAVNEMSLNIVHNLELRRQYEDDLTVARDQAVQANRAKSDFLANMSHELRTPLNAIIGYSEMLQEEAADLDQSAMVPDLERINAAGHHLLTLINDVLDLSKIEAGRMEVFIEEFELGEMINEVVSVVQPLIAKNGNRLEHQVSAGIGAMRADATKVRQVMFNLLSNAAKFTTDGTVSLNAHSRTENGQEWIELIVRDSGIGMNEAQLERIFTEFTQADSSISSRFGGTGLGLTISQRNIRLMGGDITVQSRVGQGSTFSVRLPRDVEPFVTTEARA